MKYLFCIFLLFSSVVKADSPIIPDWIMGAQVKQRNGIVYVRVTLAGLTGCYTNITSQIVALPDRWQSLSDLSANIPPLSLIDQQVCEDRIPDILWIVAPNPLATDIPPTRPLKDDAYVNRWRIRTGLPCASETIKVYSSTSEYHYAVNDAGQRGITVCVKR